MEGLYDLNKPAFEGTMPVWADGNGYTALLVADSYIADLAADQYLADISSGDRVSSVALTTLAINYTLRSFDAADSTFPAVAPGDVVDAVVIYHDTGDPATSELIARVEALSSLPYTTNGNDVLVAWAAYIFRI